MSSSTLQFSGANQVSRGRGLLNVLRRRTEWRGVTLLVVVGAIMAASEPLVFTAYGTTLDRVALTGTIALGLTVVILMGELDLSVGSTTVVAGVVLAKAPNLTVGILLALLAGLVIGLINAFLVVKVQISSFIATLGMLFVLDGLAIVLSDAKPIQVKEIDAAVSFGEPLIGPVTPRTVIFLVAALLLHLFLTRHRAGREIFAVGGNRQAARDAGIPVDRRLASGFIVCAVLAAGAGAINTIVQTTADPTADPTILLSSIAAAIIGGVVLTGGRGSILGTLIGATALGILEIGLTVTGVQDDIQQIYIGGVLLLAIVTDPNSLRAVRASIRSFTETVKARTHSREPAPPTPAVS